jgi:hypothetical protein
MLFSSKKALLLNFNQFWAILATFKQINWPFSWDRNVNFLRKYLGVY